MKYLWVCTELLAGGANMPEQRPLGRIRITPQDGEREQLMLEMYSAGGAISSEQRKRPSVMLRVVPQPLDEFAQHRRARRRIGEHVKLAVEGEKLFDRLGGLYGLDQRQQPVKLWLRQARDGSTCSRTW